MPQLKVGIHLTCLKRPLRQALVLARQLGADAVELDGRGELRPGNLSQTGLRQLRKELDDLNLRVCAVGFHTRRGYGVAEDLEPRIEATRQAMQFAYKLGAGLVINHVGSIPPESSGPEWDLLAESLAELGRYGHHVGALLAAETGSESGADLARLLAALPTGSLGVDLDPGSLIANGFSPLEAIQHLGPSILHVHARDAVRDTSRGRGQEVQLGRGSVDFPALLSALEEHAYRGYFTVLREGGTDPASDIGRAVQYLKALG